MQSIEKSFHHRNETLVIFSKTFGNFVSYYIDGELVAQNEIPLQLSIQALAHFESFHHLVVSLNTWGLDPFSPVSNVPNTGAGETPNDTPAHNPLSNGVPVSNDYDDVYTCSECGCFTDYLVGAGSRCRQCFDEMGF